MKLNLMRDLILREICTRQPITVTALAEKLEISKGSSIYRYLREFKKQGLVEMVKEKDDKKRQKGNPTFITLTKKGETLYGPITTNKKESIDEIIEKIKKLK